MTDGADVRRLDRIHHGRGQTGPAVHAESGPTGLIIEPDEIIEATARLAGALDDIRVALPAGA